MKVKQRYVLCLHRPDGVNQPVMELEGRDMSLTETEWAIMSALDFTLRQLDAYEDGEK